MVLGALGSLSSQAIRGLARNLFPGFYERKISANQALRELRDVGLGYRRSDFLSDFRAGKDFYAQSALVKFVNIDKTPTEDILNPVYHGVPDRYSFVFKTSGYDIETGEESQQYYFYHRNSIQTRGEMETEAQDWLNEQSDKYGFLGEQTSIVEGYINPVWA